MNKIIYFAFSILLISCSSSNENQNSNLSGDWNLSKVIADFSPDNSRVDFLKGEVVWKINESEQKLIVANNIITLGPKQTISGLKSGTYIFKKNENGTFTINTDKVKIKLTSNRLLEIDYGREVDAPVYEFKK